MKIKIVQVTVTVYCTCGSRATFTGADVRPAIKLWRRDHIGGEHAPCTRSEFQRLKRRKPAKIKPVRSAQQSELFT